MFCADATFATGTIVNFYKNSTLSASGSFAYTGALYWWADLSYATSGTYEFIKDWGGGWFSNTVPSWYYSLLDICNGADLVTPPLTSDDIFGTATWGLHDVGYFSGGITNWFGTWSSISLPTFAFSGACLTPTEEPYSWWFSGTLDIPLIGTYTVLDEPFYPFSWIYCIKIEIESFINWLW